MNSSFVKQLNKTITELPECKLSLEVMVGWRIKNLGFLRA